MNDLTDKERAGMIAVIEAAVARHCEPHDGYPDMDDILDSIYPVIAHKVASECAEVVLGIDGDEITAASASSVAGIILALHPAPTTPEGQNNG